jgi:hypothetical protein
MPVEREVPMAGKTPPSPILVVYFRLFAGLPLLPMMELSMALWYKLMVMQNVAAASS